MVMVCGEHWRGRLAWAIDVVDWRGRLAWLIGGTQRNFYRRGQPLLPVRMPICSGFITHDCYLPFGSHHLNSDNIVTSPGFRSERRLWRLCSTRLFEIPLDSTEESVQSVPVELQELTKSMTTLLQLPLRFHLGFSFRLYYLSLSLIQDDQKTVVPVSHSWSLVHTRYVMGTHP